MVNEVLNLAMLALILSNLCLVLYIKQQSLSEIAKQTLLAPVCKCNRLAGAAVKYNHSGSTIINSKASVHSG
jgi:hypothetical protein